MSDNTSDIIELLKGRELTPEEAERIIIVLRRRVRYCRKPDQVSGVAAMVAIAEANIGTDISK